MGIIDISDLKENTTQIRQTYTPAEWSEIKRFGEVQYNAFELPPLPDDINKLRDFGIGLSKTCPSGFPEIGITLAQL